jgi:amidase
MDAMAQAELVRTGEVSAAELVDAAIDRIERIDPALNAVVIRWFDHAREVARAPLPDGPLRGVPLLLKDLWAAYAGQHMSNGNAALKAADHRPTADTTLVERYRRAGFVILGRTNSPELGAVPVTEPEAWGPTRNPWDTSRTPGGSSGGAAAAVASGMVPAAHASDGGGSIRIPASCCGLVGLKVSQGRISMGPSRDESNLGVEHVVTRTVRDSAAILDATHGPGIGDTVIAPAPARPYLDEVGTEPGRLRIGLLDHHPQHDASVLDPNAPGFVHPDCVDAVRRAAALLESLGHHVEPGFPSAMSDTTVGARFGAMWSTNMGVSLRRFADLVGRELGPGDAEAMNLAQAEWARNLSAVDYALATSAAVAYRRAVQSWWSDGWDLLLTPTLAEPPLPIGTIRNDPRSPMAPLTRAGRFVPFTPTFNTSGQPAISLPLHWNDDGLPIGVQLVAAYGREDLLIRVAAQLEQAAPWADRRPTI